MGALTFDALLRRLKQGVPDPVYYLHGDEDLPTDEAVRPPIARARAREAGGARRRRVAARDPGGRRGAGRGAPGRDASGPRGRDPRAAGSGGRAAGGAHSRAGRHERCPHADRAGYAPRRHGAGPCRARSGLATGPARSAAPVAPAGGPPLRPRELGGNGGALGPLGRAVERARARAGPAARTRRGPVPEVEHVERRGGNDGPARLVVRRARAGGGVTAARRLGGWTVCVLLLLPVYAPSRLAGQSD